MKREGAEGQMILDLDQLKRDGLNPEQVAADVARLLGHGDTCEGPTFPVGSVLRSYCDGCGAKNVYGLHKRIPLPVDAVRVELLEWIGAQHSRVTMMYYGRFETHPHRLRLYKTRLDEPRAVVAFTNLTDESLALGVAAVELFKDKS